MSVVEKLMAQGSFQLKLRANAPQHIVDAVEFAGHLIITDQEIDIEAMSDADVRALARYMGVVVYKPVMDNQLRIKGAGLSWWLGDSRQRGLVLRGTDKMEWVNEDFDQAITDVLAVTRSPITAGTLETPAGTFTQTLDMVTQRQAIEEVCAAFGAEYRVNRDWTLDAGASGFLFEDPPLVTAVRKFGGPDPNTDGLLLSHLESAEDIEEWIETAIVAGSGTGNTVTYEEDTLGTNPYKNPQGTNFKREQVFNEPQLESAAASTRATELLNVYGTNKKIVKLRLEDFDVTNGRFEVGDLIYVWDPIHGLTDSSNELHYRGQALNPIAIRVVGKTWPVTKGMGVYFRDDTGSYTDLTQHIESEAGEVKIEVGANSRNLVENRSEALAARITTDPDGNDTLGPNFPPHTSTPWASATYTDDEGARRATIVPTWSLPTNTDSSTITDGSHYTVRWRRTGTTEYQYMTVPWGVLSAVIDDLPPGVSFDVSVSASDVNGNESTYDSDEVITTAAQTGVPSQPSAPTVAGNPLNVQVVHDLQKQATGDLEDDLDHLNVYGSTSSGFTPSNANKLGEIPATKANIDLGIDVIGTFPFYDTTTRYVVVTAVNKAGGESPKSPEATVTAELIDTQHVTDLAVTTAKIDDLAVSTAKIALLAVDTAQIANAAIEDAKINDLSASKINAGTMSADYLGTGETGAITITIGTGGKIQSTDADPDVVINGDGSAVFKNVTVTGTINANAGYLGTLDISGTLTMDTGGVIRTATSGNRIEIADSVADRIRFYSGGSVESAPGYVASSGGSSTTSLSIGGNSAGSGKTSSLTLEANSTTGGRAVLTAIGGTTPKVEFSVGATTPLQLLTSQAQFVAGSSGTPGISFWADTNTGIYRMGENQLGFAAGGEAVMYMSTDYLTNADATDRPAIRFDGTSAQGTPAYSFYGDTNTGMYRYGSDVIGFSTGATWRLLVATTEIIPNVPIRMNTSGSVSAPAISYNTDNNTGFYRTAADYHAVTAGGVIVQQWGYTGSVKEIYFYGLQASDQNDVQYHGTTGLLSYVSSTLKIKKDIRPLEVGLTDRLRPSRFKYRRNDEITAKHMSVAEDSWDTEQVGFIAEWTSDEIPEAGIHHDDYKRAVNYKHRAVLAATVADLQDARKRLLAQEEAMDEMRARIERLEKAA